VRTHFGDFAGESTTSITSSMKGENSGNNGSDLNKGNILMPTFDTLTEEGRKPFKAYLTDLKELFLSCCEVTQQGTVLRGTTPIVFNKPEVTPEVRSDPTPSHNDIKIMINFALERQAKSTDYYDQLPYPRGYRVPEFSKFSGEDCKTTLDHVGQFILQCGEASANDTLKLRMFPLSLSGTAFTWFTSLAPNSVFIWAHLEQKFYEYFYSGNTELRLSHLIAIKQKHAEPIADYIRRFKDTRNLCFNMNISYKDWVDLTYSGLSSHLRKKLESHVFFDVRQVLQRALNYESRAK
jgi:hypothetical protein